MNTTGALRQTANGEEVIAIADQPLQAGEDSGLDTRRVTDGYVYTNVDADGTIKTGSGYVAGYIVTAGAVTTLVLYDGLSTGGTLLHKAAAVDASATSVIVPFPKPLKYVQGLYADIGGASAAVNVIYI